MIRNIKRVLTILLIFNVIIPIVMLHSLDILHFILAAMSPTYHKAFDKVDL